MGKAQLHIHSRNTKLGQLPTSWGTALCLPPWRPGSSRLVSLGALVYKLWNCAGSGGSSIARAVRGVEADASSVRSFLAGLCFSSSSEAESESE